MPATTFLPKHASGKKQTRLRRKEGVGQGEAVQHDMSSPAIISCFRASS